jgi:hypothetical protein
MAEMRTWLDHYQAEPILFELIDSSESEVGFRVQFQKANDASAFAAQFGGELLGDGGVPANFAA